MASCGRRGGLLPVRHWAQASEPELDAIHVMIANVVVKSFLQRLGRVERVEMEQLGVPPPARAHPRARRQRWCCTG